MNNSDQITNLLPNISQLMRVNLDDIKKIIRELEYANISFSSAYEEYQSGGWYTAMLYNPVGREENIEICDGKAIPTEIMKNMPFTKSFIERLGLDFFAIRIAKSSPDAFLWEHKDYIELGEDEKLRLHLPLITNSNARMQFPEYSVHMEKGVIWKLNPTVSHAISNEGQEERTHLILDCYINDTLQGLIKKEYLDSANVRELPIFSQTEKSERLKLSRELLIKKGITEAEAVLLKTFHVFNLGNESSYDLLIDFHAGVGFREKEHYWILEKMKRLFMRDKLNPAMQDNKVLGTFIDAEYHDSNFPQFEILKDTLKSCTEIDGLNSAYLRGSLSRGDFDSHSDIDILCVVVPDKFEKFIDAAHKMVKEKYPVSLPAWTDTIVKDFGGIGFTYLIERDHHIQHLDLYIACLGNPKLKRLDEVPAKQLIYEVKRSNSLDNQQYSRLVREHFAVNEGEIMTIIDSINNNSDTPEKTFIELSVLGIMIKKCLMRRNDILASGEFSSWKKVFIKLARQKFDPELRDYGFYHVDKLEKKAKDGGDLYKKIMSMTNAPFNYENFCSHHGYAFEFLKREFPEVWIEHGEIAEIITRNIFNSVT